MSNETAIVPNAVLDNMERELTPDPNVAKFAPPKYRSTMPGNGELERIQSNLRKSTGEVLEHLQQLQIWIDSTKTALETMLRSVG
jgi:hypothetical protein